jgi:hypothetical protein
MNVKLAQWIATVSANWDESMSRRHGFLEDIVFYVIAVRRKVFL